MNRIAVLCIGFICIACALVFTSCEKWPYDSDPSLDEIIAIGKGYLMENKGIDAAEAFKAAQEKCEYSTDANFGLMLAHTMQLVNLADQLVEMFGSLFYTLPPDTETGEPGVIRQAQSSEPIGDYIQEYLADTIENDFDENESLFLLLDEEEEFLFDIEYYKIIFAGESLIDFGGEFDKTDLYLFGAVTSLLETVIDIVLAHDINFDLAGLEVPEMDFTNDPIGAIKGILDLIEGLLTDPEYPDFLKVQGEDGFIRMQGAGINIGNAFDRLASMFTQLGTETDYQFDDQIRYFDVEKNNKYDSQIDPIQIVNLLTLDPGLGPVLHELFVNLSYAFWEGSQFDVHPYKKDTLNLGMFNDLLIHMGVINQPLLPEWLGINVGAFFANPSVDGLRTLLFAIIDLVNAAFELIGV